MTSPTMGSDGDRGSATVVVAAVIGSLLVFALGVADVARVLVTAARAQAAADAAALAAAQSLAIPDAGEPVDVAGEFAVRNGAALESCECEPGTFVATVSVRTQVGELFLFGDGRSVTAEARAQVDVPAG